MTIGKKFFILLVSFFYFGRLTGQIDTSIVIGDWICTKSLIHDTIDSEMLNGIFISFNSEGAIFRSAFDDSTQFFSYQEMDSLERIDSSSYYKVISTDSLIFGDSLNSTHFYPIKKVKSELTKNIFTDILLNNTWKTNDCNLPRFRFVDFIETNFLGRRMNLFLVENKEGVFEYADYWFIYEFQDYLFLAFSLEDNFNFYQIINYKNNRIQYVNYSKNQSFDFDFVPERKLSHEELEKLRKGISGNEWKTYEKKSSEFFLDKTELGLYLFSDSLDYQVLPNILKHSKTYPIFIKYISFQNNFSFDRLGNYKIYRGKKVYSEGKWNLTNDGLYIILNSGTNEEYYLRIIKFNDDELVIGQNLVLNFDKKSKDLGIVNLIIKMKN